MQRLLSEHIYWDAKHVFKVLCERDLVKQCAVRFKVNEQVHITLRRLLAGSNRTEEPHVAGTICVRQLNNCRALPFYKCSKSRRLLV